MRGRRRRERAPARRERHCGAASTVRARWRLRAARPSPRLRPGWLRSRAAITGSSAMSASCTASNRCPGTPRARRGEGVERIDRLRHFADAAVAVAQHARDPARIGEAAAHDARDLLGDGARHRRLRPAGVEVIELRRAPRHVPRRRRSRRRNRRRRRRRAGRARGRPADARAHRQQRRARRMPPSPRCRRRRSRRRASRPRDRLAPRSSRVAPHGVERRIGRAGAVDAWRRRRRCATGCRRRRRAAASGFQSSSSSSAATRATAMSNSAICAWKMSRNSPEMRSVTSMRGRSSRAMRQDLDAGDAVGARVPGRPRAEIGERLREIVAAGAQRRRRPQVEHDRARVFAFVLQMPAHHLGCRARADGGGGPRRDGARIDGRQVAPGRQHVEPAARRRAGRPRRHAPSVERREQACALAGGAIVDQLGHALLASSVERAPSMPRSVLAPAPRAHLPSARGRTRAGCRGWRGP